MSSLGGQLPAINNVSVDEFVKKLIVEKCRDLIERESMLPVSVVGKLTRDVDDYVAEPSDEKFDNLRNLFAQTQNVYDNIQMKDFTRALLLIVTRVGATKLRDYFGAQSSVGRPLDLAIQKLSTVKSNLEDSPRALLQHYNECIRNLQSGTYGTEDHHLLAFAKELIILSFTDTIRGFIGAHSPASVIDLARAPPKQNLWAPHKIFAAHPPPPPPPPPPTPNKSNRRTILLTPAFALNDITQ